jgi:hypothetical protein
MTVDRGREQHHATCIVGSGETTPRDSLRVCWVRDKRMSQIVFYSRCRLRLPVPWRYSSVRKPIRERALANRRRAS